MPAGELVKATIKYTDGHCPQSGISSMFSAVGQSPLTAMERCRQLAAVAEPREPLFPACCSERDPRPLGHGCAPTDGGSLDTSQCWWGVWPAPAKACIEGRSSGSFHTGETALLSPRVASQSGGCPEHGGPAWTVCKHGNIPRLRGLRVRAAHGRFAVRLGQCHRAASIRDFSNCILLQV